MRPDRPIGRRRKGAGFTLIEVVIVVAVLSIIAATMAPLIAAQVDRAREDATTQHLEALRDALRAYYLDVNAFPPGTGNAATDLSQLESNTLAKPGWKGPYLTSEYRAGDYAEDAWGSPLGYTYAAGSPTAQLTSPGRDHVASTADDITLTVVMDYNAVQRRASTTLERLKLIAGDIYGNNPSAAPSTYSVPAQWAKDDWGRNNLYVYKNGSSAVVYSPGPDGVAGAGSPSGDDIYYAMVWAPQGGAAPTTTKINFQPLSSPVPSGYTAVDNSKYVAGKYGWNQTSNLSPVSRGIQADPLLDTLVQANSSRRFDYDVANGTYLVSLSVGDPAFARSQQYVRLEATTVINKKPTQANKFITVTDQAILVTDGKLSVTIGGGTSPTTLNWLTFRLQ